MTDGLHRIVAIALLPSNYDAGLIGGSDGRREATESLSICFAVPAGRTDGCPQASVACYVTSREAPSARRNYASIMSRDTLSLFREDRRCARRGRLLFTIRRGGGGSPLPGLFC